ncbi:probable methyltransferase-like protein 24 [Haliotis rufescens]|uniref:probable methyltransferase-like protein 24 n=1 Tax=Haliotis rufescens TaxID=6454 RepID=UPI00201F9829|nr:probable methyltransferase-like protein 24 [Haliotis rufescens]
MRRITLGKLFIGVSTVALTIFVFVSLSDTISSRNKKEIDELVHAVQRLRKLAKTKGIHVQEEGTYPAAPGTGDKVTGRGEPNISENLQGGSSFRITEYWQASSLIKWDFEKPPEYDCKNKSSAGIYFICQDPPFTIKPPCIAYSFGVYTKWAFEETLGRMGCDTHSFDPSVKWDDHIHKGVVNFHKLGIGAEDTDTYKPARGMYVKEDQTWKMRTLPSIMKMLGHEGKVIDVLKVDVEGFEWAMMRQMLDTGIIHRVRQFIIEWHLVRDFPAKQTYMDLLRLYYRMKDAGFRTFSVDFRFPGFSLKRWRIQSDVMYVNTKFSPNSQ